MRAAVLEQVRQPLVITEVPHAQPGPRDVLIRVHACGVCHTDLHVWDGLFEAFGIAPSSILGHEVVGVVEAAGDEVAHLQPGDRVGVCYCLSCGYCRFCIEGQEEVCPNVRWVGLSGAEGGYAEYIVVPAANALPLPPQLDFESAAPLFCAGVTVYAALKDAGVRPSMRVAVLGIGGLGHLGVSIARAMGTEVIAMTSTAAKSDVARQLGAHEVITGEGMGQQLQAMGGADVILSTTVDTPAIIDALQGLAPLGTLALTGVTVEPVPIVPAMLINQQQRVIGSILGSRADMRELLRLAVLYDIRPVTETYSLDEVNDVHERLRANEVRFRAVLTPS